TMSDQRFLAFDDLEWSWEAQRPIFGWLPGDVAGYVWHATREEAAAAAGKPFCGGRPFYRRTRLVSCRVGEGGSGRGPIL
ncbi:MAG: hypothetical protein KF861_10035, partial [Planctomycetaceae bacterium]|nr:hypothetical protein [Planctomycetaceae bacterium]